MERDLGIRRPAPSKSEGLSKTAKTFFGLNIFQVFAIGGIQGAMIIWGDFSPVNEKGLGPGRRIYMALFLGSVLYSCFLCLFAVKKQNFLEILAFVLQNYAFIVYSGIQVYHISFKEYENYQIQRQKLLVYLTIVDSTGLFVLNIIFTCLAVKLYREYGWKIYKRVRFNIRLRAAFHLYETVVMLLKMEFLFLTTFAICLNQTILREKYKTFSYIASFVSIPLCFGVSLAGVWSIRRENKAVAGFFILGVLSALVYFVFKMARVATKTCTGCQEFLKLTEDIPGEVDMHIIYLATINLVLLTSLLVASIKAFRNFGIGLAAHFDASAGPKLTVLNLSKNVLTSIVTSSGEDRSVNMDIESPRPSISNEPRPSIFQYLPKFISSVGNGYIPEESEHGKWLSLPTQFHRRQKPLQIQSPNSSAKRRFSQLFWDRELGRNGSNRSSLSSRRVSSCFRGCCPWIKSRQHSASTDGMFQTENMTTGGDVLDNGSIPGSRMGNSSLYGNRSLHGNRLNENGSVYGNSSVIGSGSVHGNGSVYSKGSAHESCNPQRKRTFDGREPARRKRSRSIDGAGCENGFLKSKPFMVRFHSLPNEDMSHDNIMFEHGESLERMWRMSLSNCDMNGETGCENGPNCQHDETGVHSPRIVVSNNNDLSQYPTDTTTQRDCLSRSNDNIRDETTTRPFDHPSSTNEYRRPTLRRSKSSITSLISATTETSEMSDYRELDFDDDGIFSSSENTTKRRKLAVVVESPERLRKAISDYDLYTSSRKKSQVRFI
eukprot:Seg4606.1 transcript_id=Seg4606.1/GoldUCD/mRNA.D3Y31 product="hypothetical protein" protein_id=Seg4606.1/GoldUCD/D3Y31